MNKGASLLADRGVIRVTGGEALGFLHRLVTNRLLNLRQGEGRYAALLTPQGKLIFDFFVVSLPEGPEPGLILDCVRAQVPELMKKLNFHKLRAKIAIEDASDGLAIAALWGQPAPEGFAGIAYADPRAPDMGLRLIGSPEILAKFATTPQQAYDEHRVALGVPKGGIDFVYGDAFVHDVDLDWLNGVDFDKGCYPGQEVVARVHFRNTARKRIVKVHFDGPAPAPGTPLMAGDRNIGQVGSIAGSQGLAQLRLDRLEEARAAGTPVKAGNVPVAVTLPKAPADQ